MIATNTALIAKVSSLVELSRQEREALANLEMELRRAPRRSDVLTRGIEPDYVYVLLSGWAARYEVRRNGARRITGFLLPGDFCGIHAICDAAMDHSVTALTDCEVGMIAQSAMAELIQSFRAISDAVWRAKLQEEATLRKWLVYASDASVAVGHLLCELYSRAESVGLASRGRLHLPLTQEEIGDALGLTSVHTNRVLKVLRDGGLIELSKAGTDHPRWPRPASRC